MLNSAKKFARSFLLFAAIVFGAVQGPEIHNHYLRHEVGDSVVKVLSMVSEGGGTGFAVRGASGKEYIMTNRHVCEVGVAGLIRIKYGTAFPVIRKIVYQDDVHDLCLIEGLKDLDPLDLGSDPVTGDFHYVVGHPGLRPITTSKGEYIGRTSIQLPFDVLRKQDCPGEILEIPPFFAAFYGRTWICLRSYDSMSTTAVIYPGNSGSPVVNSYGNLIGVAFAGSTRQERDNFLIPLRYIKRVLNKF